MTHTRKFDLNIEKILEDWDIYHAIREVIANAIDEETLSATRGINISKDEKKRWHIRDYGRGLKYEHLTQKENEEKLKSPHVIGKFGIGLKDALATFDRKGINVHMKSRYGDITLIRSGKHDFEDLITLHAHVNPPSNTNLKGTDFIIDGCTYKDIEKAKAFFLRFSGERFLESTKFGDVLKRSGNAARIYINGVRVAEEENFLFSYNITSLTKAIRRALNRERTNVGRSAYSDRVRAILLSCESDFVAEKIVADLPGYEDGTLHDELQWTDVNIHACKLLSSAKGVVFLTPDEIIDTPDMVDKAKGDGYEIIAIPENIKEKISGQLDSTGNVIRDLGQFKREWNESFEFRFVDVKEMASRERKIFGLTDKILEFVGGKPSEVKEILISQTMRLDSTTFEEASGLWENITGRIIIKREQLKDLRSYAGTLLHEIAHVKSGASDISREFEQELTSMIGMLISRNIEK